MLTETAVCVEACDPISRAGITEAIRGRPGVLVVDAGSQATPDVAVVVVDEVDDGAVQTIRNLSRSIGARVVVVATRLDDAGLMAAVDAGVSGLLRRSEAGPDSLLEAIRRAMSGDGVVPPDLLGRLLAQVARLSSQVLSPRGITFSGLTHREVDVLKLVAKGMSTGEIAGELSYSERTIKNVLHDVTTRLQLRNRSHAVAYALREGLI